MFPLQQGLMDLVGKLRLELFGMTALGSPEGEAIGNAEWGSK
jgi:hypothetical protein